MYQDIKKIIPHRDPMIMVDGYKKINDDTANAEKTFLPNDYSIHNGYVVDSILIECIAQTVAAHFGYYYLTNDDDNVKPGMLVTVDSFNFRDRVKEDSKISIRITKTNEIGPFSIFYGEIKCMNKLIADGEIKVVIP